MASGTSLTQIANAGCPRCGYDLSAITETWQESCPARGICSECGLEFHWCELLNPRLRRLPWLFEHAPLRHLLPSFLRSLFTAMIPTRFWRRVQLHHDPDMLRLALFCAGSIASIPILYFICVCVELVALQGEFIYVCYSHGWVSNYDMMSVRITRLLYPFPWTQEFFPHQRSAYGLVLIPLIFSAGFASVLLVDQSERLRSKANPRHVFRIWAYSCAFAPLILVWPMLIWTWEEIWSVASWNPNAPAILDSLSPPKFLTGALIFWRREILYLAPLALALLWLIVWWWSALGQGLRLPARLSAFCGGLVVAALLAALVASTDRSLMTWFFIR